MEIKKKPKPFNYAKKTPFTNLKISNKSSNKNKEDSNKKDKIIHKSKSSYKKEEILINEKTIQSYDEIPENHLYD